MKKLLSLLLVLLLTFSLAACTNNENTDPSGSDNPGVSQSGENNEDQGGENSTVNPEDIDFAAIMAGNGATDVVWANRTKPQSRLL